MKEMLKFIIIMYYIHDHTLLHGSPGWTASDRLGWGRALDRRGAPAMPFKANRDRRYHIPKQRHRVTNWGTRSAACGRHAAGARATARRPGPNGSGWRGPPPGRAPETA